MKTLFLSAGMLFIISVTAFSRQRDFEYCQVAAHGDWADDPHVDKFLFGKPHIDYADSLLKVFKQQYGKLDKSLFASLNRHYYVTDALNFLKTLGWELDTVYTVSPTRTANGLTSNALFFYVLKRKAGP